jgi:hypothetical protein
MGFNSGFKGLISGRYGNFPHRHRVQTGCRILPPACKTSPGHFSRSRALGFKLETARSPSFGDRAYKYV